MRNLTLLLTLCLFSIAKAEPPKRDLAELASLMAGEYTVIGKRPDSGTTYFGHLSFRAHGQKLAFVRIINGDTVRGTAIFDTVAGLDRIPVLRLPFAQDGRPYEGTYQWTGDYNNYIRFTGYVYLPGTKTKAAGLEAFLPHSSLHPRLEPRSHPCSPRDMISQVLSEP